MTLRTQRVLVALGVQPRLLPDDSFCTPAAAGPTTALGMPRSFGPRPARDRFATHSAILPRAPGSCIARTIRKLNRAGLTSDAALPVS